MESKRSYRQCCVVNCTNSEKGANDLSIKFYSFPEKHHEVNRKQQWIIAVNRKNPDGSLWHPTPRSRICSKHFIGGKKCDNLNEPGYIPTIFPFKKAAKNFTKLRKVYALSAFKGKVKNSTNKATQINFEYDTTSFVFSSSSDTLNDNCKFVQCNIGSSFGTIRPTMKDANCGPCGMFLSDVLNDIVKRQNAKIKLN